MDHKKVKSKKLKVKSFWRGSNFIPPVFGEEIPLGQIGGGPKEGFGPWGNLGSQSINEATNAIAGLMSRGLGVATIIAGLWFLLQFILGGYDYMTAGGDQQKMTNATKKITSALIGLIIVVAAYAVMSLLGELLGFKFLNLGSLIEKLGP
jgi:hypothetical protein